MCIIHCDINVIMCNMRMSKHLINTFISLLKYSQNAIGVHSPVIGYLGVQQCFGVVYHELTTLRQVYFARAVLAGRAK